MASANTNLESYAKLKELGVSVKLLDGLSPASLEQLLTSVAALLESHKGRPRSKQGNRVLEGGIKVGLTSMPLLIWLASQKSNMLPVFTNQILI